MLKSTVFALLIVLVVLSGAFFLIKNKGGKGYLQNFAKKCEKASEIRIPAAIEKIEVKGEVITVLTKPSRSNSQEIVKIDADCGTELGRISVKISESSPVEKSERK